MALVLAWIVTPYLWINDSASRAAVSCKIIYFSPHSSSRAHIGLTNVASPAYAACQPLTCALASSRIMLTFRPCLPHSAAPRKGGLQPLVLHASGVLGLPCVLSSLPPLFDCHFLGYLSRSPACAKVKFPSQLLPLVTSTSPYPIPMTSVLGSSICPMHVNLSLDFAYTRQ